MKNDEEEEKSLPVGYWHRTDIIECGEKRFTADEDGRYMLLLINWGDEPAEVSRRCRCLAGR
jgi:hypothetical protein